MDLSEFKAIETDNVKDELVLYIEELILTGRLKPNDRLPSERELAAYYRVSRPVIHECILSLENKSLVRLRPRHGVVINNYRKEGTLDLLLSLLQGQDHDLGPDIHADLEHFRSHMDKDIVRLICCRGNEASAELKELDEINNRMAEAESPEDLSELDFQFHMRLALSSGNTVYALLLNTLKSAHTKYLTHFFQEPGIREKAVLYHKQLITALLARDEQQAEALIVKIDSYATYRD